jgi:Ser/Thr protein kinase RdoA (MazF antagonist)
LALDEQAARVAGLLTARDGATWAALRRLGVGDAWLVRRGVERLTLKPGRTEQDETDVTWEHDYLRRLAATGFPASATVPAFDGQSWVCLEGRIWAALSYLPGQPLGSEPAPDMAAAGAFLARYHQAARTIPVPGQRPTAAELSQLDALMHWQNLRTALGDVVKLGMVNGMLFTVESGLKGLEYAALERLVIHGDATNENLIVDGSPPSVVGLIDFGAAHVAPWPVDIAAALWRSGRSNPDDVAYDPDRIRRFVVGYHRVSPLPRAIAGAIPLLMEARGLQLICRRVRRLPQGPSGGPVPSVLDALARVKWLRGEREELAYIITCAVRDTHVETGRDA